MSTFCVHLAEVPHVLIPVLLSSSLSLSFSWHNAFRAGMREHLQFLCTAIYFEVFKWFSVEEWGETSSPAISKQDLVTTYQTSVTKSLSLSYKNMKAEPRGFMRSPRQPPPLPSRLSSPQNHFRHLSAILLKTRSEGDSTSQASYHRVSFSFSLGSFS